MYELVRTFALCLHSGSRDTTRGIYHPKDELNRNLLNFLTFVLARLLNTATAAFVYNFTSIISWMTDLTIEVMLMKYQTLQASPCGYELCGSFFTHDFQNHSKLQTFLYYFFQVLFLGSSIRTNGIFSLN